MPLYPEVLSNALSPLQITMAFDAKAQARNLSSSGSVQTASVSGFTSTMVASMTNSSSKGSISTPGNLRSISSPTRRYSSRISGEMISSIFLSRQAARISWGTPEKKIPEIKTWYL